MANVYYEKHGKPEPDQIQARRRHRLRQPGACARPEHARQRRQRHGRDSMPAARRPIAQSRTDFR